jgi:hypothetical protein
MKFRIRVVHPDLDLDDRPNKSDVGLYVMPISLLTVYVQPTGAVHDIDPSNAHLVWQDGTLQIWMCAFYTGRIVRLLESEVEVV